jgi:hypothetical protein
MQMFLAMRTVAGETAKLAMALGAILLPLFFVTLAIDHIRGSASVPVFSVASLLKGVWF